MEGSTGSPQVGAPFPYRMHPRGTGVSGKARVVRRTVPGLSRSKTNSFFFGAQTDHHFSQTGTPEMQLQRVSKSLGSRESYTGSLATKEFDHQERIAQRARRSFWLFCCFCARISLMCLVVRLTPAKQGFSAITLLVGVLLFEQILNLGIMMTFLCWRSKIFSGSVQEASRLSILCQLTTLEEVTTILELLYYGLLLLFLVKGVSYLTALSAIHTLIVLFAKLANSGSWKLRSFRVTVVYTCQELSALVWNIIHLLIAALLDGLTASLDQLLDYACWALFSLSIMFTLCILYILARKTCQISNQTSTLLVGQLKRMIIWVFITFLGGSGLLLALLKTLNECWLETSQFRCIASDICLVVGSLWGAATIVAQTWMRLPIQTVIGEFISESEGNISESSGRLAQRLASIFPDQQSTRGLVRVNENYSGIGVPSHSVPPANPEGTILSPEVGHRMGYSSGTIAGIDLTSREYRDSPIFSLKSKDHVSEEENKSQSFQKLNQEPNPPKPSISGESSSFAHYYRSHGDYFRAGPAMPTIYSESVQSSQEQPTLPPQGLRHQESGDYDHQSSHSADQCFICRRNPSECAFAPCGHRGICSPCGNAVLSNSAACPLCHLTVIEIVPIPVRPIHIQVQHEFSGDPVRKSEEHNFSCPNMVRDAERLLNPIISRSQQEPQFMVGDPREPNHFEDQTLHNRQTGNFMGTEREELTLYTAEPAMSTKIDELADHAGDITRKGDYSQLTVLKIDQSTQRRFTGQILPEQSMLLNDGLDLQVVPELSKNSPPADLLSRSYVESYIQSNMNLKTTTEALYRHQKVAAQLGYSKKYLHSFELMDDYCIDPVTISKLQSNQDPRLQEERIFPTHDSFVSQNDPNSMLASLRKLEGPIASSRHNKNNPKPTEKKKADYTLEESCSESRDHN